MGGQRARRRYVKLNLRVCVKFSHVIQVSLLVLGCWLQKVPSRVSLRWFAFAFCAWLCSVFLLVLGLILVDCVWIDFRLRSSSKVRAYFSKSKVQNMRFSGPIRSLQPPLVSAEPRTRGKLGTARLGYPGIYIWKVHQYHCVYYICSSGDYLRRWF